MNVKIKAADKTFNFLRASKARINLLQGGAGSSKSWSIALHLILKFVQEKDITILVIRKTTPALRKSCFKLISNLLHKIQIPAEINKSDLSIKFGTNEILFTGIDDVNKLNSIESINYVWVEEATEISAADFNQIDLRVRGKNSNGPNQLYFSFNPNDYSSFLRKLTQKLPDDTALNLSTHKDNPFLDKAYRQRIERLISVDETFYKIYCLNEWAQTGNIIYTRWDICIARDWPIKFDEVSYGLDFGFAGSQTALLEINRIAQEVWIRQLVYQTGLTNTQLIAKLATLHVDKESLITADNERPDSIQEIEDAGYFIQPCIKGQGSVKHGIDICKRFVKHIHEDSIDVIEEIQGYKWQKDKQGHILEKPVKWKDHAMDALRYDLSRHEDQVPELVSLYEEVKQPNQDQHYVEFELDLDAIERAREQRILDNLDI